MYDTLRDRVLRFLRVPPQPTAPDGGRVLRVFRASTAYFRYRLIFWALRQVGSLIALIFGFLFVASMVRAIDHPTATAVLTGLEVFAVVSYLLQMGWTYVMLRLDFEMRWYILSDRSLRVREGITSLREKTVTFANIQNISIHQNPLQRLVGIADVKVRTAGGGASTTEANGGFVGESMHEAVFRGVDNPEEIRAVIRERVRLHRDAGLGDPDEPHAPPPPALPSDAAVLIAARDLLDEMRALRLAATMGVSE